MRKNIRFHQYPETLVLWLFECDGWVVEAGINLYADDSKVFFINGIHDEYTYYRTYEELVVAVTKVSEASNRTLINNLAFTNVELLINVLKRLHIHGAK